MDHDELIKLPTAIDVETAGRALGLGRTKAYELARTDQFPVRVLQLGRAKRVVTADLLRFLGVDRGTREQEGIAEAAEELGGGAA